jgi:hypothetical protein
MHIKKTIGTMQESTLHAQLKNWYAQPGDLVEHTIEGYFIDIVRDDLLIEIQTSNFSRMKSKLQKLLENYPLTVVYPIAEQKWILKVAEEGNIISRRKSPKKGRLEDLFYELVHISNFAKHPNFMLDVLLIHQEDIWCNDGKGSWRRKGYSIIDRRLKSVEGKVSFSSLKDYLTLIPTELPRPFTNKELAQTLKIPIRLAQKTTYSLCAMEVLAITEKRGRAHLFAEK